MDEEKVEAAHSRESRSHLHRHFLLRAHISLLTGDLDDAACTFRSLLIHQVLGKGLVSGSDYLMDREFE